MNKQQIQNAISDALVKLWLHKESRAEAVFYRSLLDQVGVTYDDQFPARAGTNGKWVKVNSEWLKLPVAQRAAVLAHEARHIYGQTMSRVKNRDRRLYNMASDVVINEGLKAGKFALPENGLFLDSPWPAEVAAKLKAMFVVHETTEEEVYNVLMQEAEACRAMAFSEDIEEGEEEDARIKIKVAAAAQAARSATNGSMPAWLEREIAELLREETPWPDAVRDWMTSMSEHELSWNSPERIILANYRMLMPDVYSETLGELVIVVDTSGSMTEELLAEVSAHISAGLAITQPEKLHVVYCDAEIAHTETYTKPLTVKLKLVGGGGTDFRPPFDWVRDNVTSPCGLIYFTDGYGTFPDNQPEYPVLWCIMKGCNTDVPWGRMVEIS